MTIAAHPRATGGRGDRRYLVAGHLCIDRLAAGSQGGPERRRVGGTTLFAAQQACRMGYRVDLVTACTQATLALAIGVLDPRIRIHTPPTATDTVFAFERGPAQGPTHLESRGDPIRDLPEPSSFTVVHLAPVASELPETLVSQVTTTRDAFVGVTAQGFLRQFASDGTLRLATTPALRTMAGADAIVVNEEEHEVLRSSPDATAFMRGHVIVTRGKDGADLYRGEQRLATAPPPTVVAARDTVGAGDVCATVVFCALAEGAAPSDALACGVQAAGLYVARGAGLASVPHRRDLGMDDPKTATRG